MNYEKFNDAMIRLRKAEEDLNKALQDVYVAIYMKDKDPMYGKMIKDKEDV